MFRSFKLQDAGAGDYVATIMIYIYIEVSRLYPQQKIGITSLFLQQAVVTAYTHECFYGLGKSRYIRGYRLHEFTEERQYSIVPVLPERIDYLSPSHLWQMVPFSTPYFVNPEYQCSSLNTIRINSVDYLQRPMSDKTYNLNYCIQGMQIDHRIMI